jgi:hypothetical protein
MQPNAVVDIALKTLERKTTAVARWINSVIAFSTRLLPRSWNPRIAGWVLGGMLKGGKTPTRVRVEQAHSAVSNLRQARMNGRTHADNA